MRITLNFLSIVGILFSANMAYSVTLINGLSVHSELGQDSFIGGLFTTTLSKSSREILIAQEEKQIQVRVLANRISARRFRRMWIEGMAINASASDLEKQSKNMAAFSNMLKVSLKKGDIFAIQRSNETVKIIINGSTLGFIEDTAFFDLLLRTWIGPVPLSSEFRNNLLVAGEYSAELQERFNSIRPADDRIEAVAAALASIGSDTASSTSQTSSSSKGLNAPAPDLATKTIIKPPKIGVAPIAAPKVVPPAPSEPEVIAAAEEPKQVKAEPEAPPATPAKNTSNTISDEQALALTEEPSSKQAEEESFDSIIEEEDEEFTAESLLAQQLYIAKLKKWTYRQLSYPQRSLDKNEQGIVKMRIVINRSGNIQSIDMLEEPEYSRLTKAAVKAVKKSQPYPLVPDSVTGDTFTFTLPIVFKLVDR